MDVTLHALGMPFNGKTIFEKSLGGSETAAYYLARELARRGHNVKVFTTHPEEGTWDGVEYINCGEPTEACPFGSKFHFFAANTPQDVLIVQRQPKAFHYQWASKVNILQCHDLGLYRQSNDVGESLWNLSAITGVSAWHCDQMAKVYPVPRDRFTVIPNGVDLDMYDSIPATEKFTNDGTLRLLYQSRPERGLEHLVRPGGIMDRLRDYPVHLHVCAYDCTVPEMVGYYAQLEAWAELLPNVSMLGALSKPDLVAVQKAMDLLVYPTEFEEVSCITAMEAMAAHLPMITSEVAALPETCADSGTILIQLKDGKADEDAFVEELIKQAGDYSRALQRGAQMDAARGVSWEKAGFDLELLCSSLLNKRSGSAIAMAKSAIEYSDIDVARYANEKRQAFANDFHANETILAMKLDRELTEMYAFTDSPEAYKAHYAKHQGAYYDGPGESAIGEDVTNTPRFRGTVLSASPKIKASGGKGLQVLDYGCAHGHYLVPLAKALPDSHLTGVDISARAIGAATRWVQQEGLGNVTLVNAGQEWLDEEKNAGKFDIVFACEVVEHVISYEDLLNQFRAVLKPDGVLIITTPYGRWEWIGREACKTGREHLRQFERQDLVDLFGKHKFDIICAPSGQDQGGVAIGSWITSVTFNGDEPLGKIDLQRKMRQYATRQTVSACYIVKNGENIFRRSLDSIADYVDEVVIGVDKTTTDRTQRVIDDFREANPWLPVRSYDIDSPTEIGFDAARNAVHDGAEGDWIFWLDADEEVIGAPQLHKYLKPSLCDGVHFPQVHYSTQPAAVIATDRPCRLYRNGIGARIYGLVHEHVEVEIGKAVPNAIMRDDIQFCHSGYITEEVRRKRFQRNMPLLIKDLEKYPDRTLNKFLYMRDAAQGIAFNPRGGSVEVQDAQRVVDMFSEMLDHPGPVSRILIDSLNYYSLCVEILGTGFEAEMQFKTKRLPLAGGSSIKGRFYNREHFLKLSNRLFKEATDKYEDKYF